MLVVVGALSGCSSSGKTEVTGRGHPSVVTQPPSSLDWSQQSPPVNPPARSGASMTYDPKIGKVVLFGGRLWPSEPNIRALNDTWTYDGSTWTKQSPPIDPPASEGASMAYDPKIGRVVLFGGRVWTSGQSFISFNDTWTYDGVTWTKQSPMSHPSPLSVYGTSMDYYPKLGQLVLLVFADNGTEAQTWSYDGVTWRRLSSANSPSVLIGTMTYDSTIGKLVLCEFGAETWTYDGATWVQEHPATSPPERAGMSMAYDPAIGRTVLVGGHTGRSMQPLNDTWVYDGSTWRQLFPSTAPTPRSDAVMAYYPPRKSLLLFGGDSNDTWIYGPNHRT